MWPTFFIMGLSRGHNDTDCWWRIIKYTPTTRVYADGASLDPELQLALPAGLYRVQGSLFYRSLNAAGGPAPGFTVTAGVEPSVYDSWSLSGVNVGAAYPVGVHDSGNLRSSVGTRSNYDTAQKGKDAAFGSGDSHQRSYVDTILHITSQATVGIKWGQVVAAASGSYTLDVGSWIAFKKLEMP